MKSSTVRRLIAISAASVLIGTASIAWSQQASDADKKFVDEALKGGKSEVELGHMAADKGASPDVKEFGEKMVTDHTKMGDQMRTVATKIGVTPPDGASIGGLATKTKLSVLSGKTFDDEYIKAMVKDHEEDLKAFRDEATGGASPEVRRAASQGAEVVQHHLAMIRKIAAAHNVQVSMNPVSPSAVASADGR